MNAKKKHLMEAQVALALARQVRARAREKPERGGCSGRSEAPGAQCPSGPKHGRLSPSGTTPALSARGLGARGTIKSRACTSYRS